MKINVTNATDDAIKAFTKKEWKIADKAHYGHDVDWNDSSTYYLRAMEDNQIVGVLYLVVRHGVAEVKDILVAHNLQGKGIGKQLMLKAEEIAKQEGSHKMFLQTGEDWDAKYLYESLGYKITGGQKNHHYHKNFVDYSKFLD